MDAQRLVLDFAGSDDPYFREVFLKKFILTDVIKQEGKEEGLKEGIVKGREEGLKEGIVKGIEKGRESLRETLTTLIEQKFGKPSFALIDEINTLDIETMKLWLKNILKVNSVEELGKMH